MKKSQTHVSGINRLTFANVNASHLVKPYWRARYVSVSVLMGRTQGNMLLLIVYFINLSNFLPIPRKTWHIENYFVLL